MWSGISNFLIVLFFIGFIYGCNSDDSSRMVDSAPEKEATSRNFRMGFTTWPYAPTLEAVTSTNMFLSSNGDIYSEHIDSNIPWNSWINSAELPNSFTEMVSNRAIRRSPENIMTLSISLLNLNRSDLMPDFDGEIPSYNSLNDEIIANAYYKHVNYLLEQLTPNYLVIAVEVDGLLKNAPEKWEAYKSLMSNVKSRIKTEYPTLPISESVMLHGFYQPDFGESGAVISEISSYVNTMDFAAISFYPFLKGLSDKSEFQAALDFLHANINKPIAFAETGHLSEDLAISSFDLSITGTQAEQNEYLESLLMNAQEENYEYIIWWTHRDYNLLWETFPEDLKDLGELWISNGIINEDGIEKLAKQSWGETFSKQFSD
ncbi:hypothetical protein MTsPCn9_08960 [Croceitalea sp. MTPC9]|uniref:hypothetical protein n=1 Tax=unclassified Croceitalea TaxID=2632280 RepID=UPI002B3BED07|nr:hypothetical protein MTsPCn6_34030 [Croceitalea sp. MTPC6]GMN15960.1 hypothetical protein MTsPCn9_08960 [Croceitalea sp. MTPC9]